MHPFDVNTTFAKDTPIGIPCFSHEIAWRSQASLCFIRFLLERNRAQKESDDTSDAFFRVLLRMGTFLRPVNFPRNTGRDVPAPKASILADAGHPTRSNRPVSADYRRPAKSFAKMSWATHVSRGKA